MLLSLPDLRARALNKGMTKVATVAKSRGQSAPADETWDVFLSYSSSDADSLDPVLGRLYEEGLTVYVDRFADADLDPDEVDDETASRLRNRLRHCGALFVLTSEQASNSRWVPWEIGFADGAGKLVAVLPVIDSRSPGNRYSGSEYLGLYPYIDEARPEISGVNDSWLWATDARDSKTYCPLGPWLNGERLYTPLDRMLRP